MRSGNEAPRAASGNGRKRRRALAAALTLAACSDSGPVADLNDLPGEGSESMGSQSGDDAMGGTDPAPGDGADGENGADAANPGGEDPTGDEPSGEGQGGDEPSGDEPNGDEPGGDEPAESFENEGMCFFEGSGVFEEGAYSGTVAFVLLAEPFGDDELCRIEFDLATVAPADPECDFCYFSTTVELSNPREVLNVDGVCENSERALGPDAIEAMLAQPPVAMGFAEEATGHGQVLVEYDAGLMRWGEVTFGSFDLDTGALEYSANDGFCRY